jgi:hypothetical protein
VIKPENLDLPALHCSLDRELGDYYQDMSPAISLVESGYHGELGDDGVPLVRYGNQGNFRNAVIAAQYALANMIAVGRGERERAERVRIQLDWLVTAQETTGTYAGCWVMRHHNPKYPWLWPPWTSALASGNAISALLRGWELFGDDRYRASADSAYRALHDPRTGLALCPDGSEDLWYEEYPGDPPLHVLNGHVYALLGVLDQARVTGDPEAERRWRRAAATALAHLEEFDLGFWSAYDLRWREPVSLHYQKNIHVPQLRILAELTGEAGFTTYADRWERQYGSTASRLRWHAALRLHGRRKRAEARTEAADEPPVSLRPFPYPFRAALSICNDADLLTPASYRRLDRFLRTDAETEWGPGLALPVAGSFFLFRSPDSPNAFTVFDHLSATMTDDGDFILDCARRGVLDVLHTYGCFTDSTHFTRRLAETGLEALRDHGITIETWVNHGPPTNVQCIGTHDGWQGDLVGAAAYHADLMVEHGVRWVWTGAEIVDRFALDASHRSSRRDRGPALVEPYVMRDGGHVRRFYRFGGLGGQTPVLDDLPKQLSAANLDELVKAGGYSVVYQHLGVRRVAPGFGPEAYGPVDDASWFRQGELAALRDLAQRYRDGEIWIAPTTRLLRYRDAHEGLRYSMHRESDADVIVISSHATGELGDLTFYCERPETTRVCVETTAGLEPVADVRANPADETGRASLTVLPSDRGGQHG